MRSTAAVVWPEASCRSDVVRFRLRTPTGGERLQIQARVLHRKFDRDYVEFALGADAAAIPISEVARAEVDVRLGAQPAPGADASPELAWRLNDLGVGSLLQGDTRSARWSFARVERLLPDAPDGPVNLARSHLADGALEELEAALQRADSVLPGYWKTAYLLAELRRAQGRFGEALVALDRALVRFPGDRVTLNAKGSLHYQAGQPEPAIAAFEAALAIDPVNVTAHSYLARAYRQLASPDLAAEHEGLAARYRQPREEAAVALRYRREHPDANRESDARHVHELRSLDDSVADCRLAVPISPASSEAPAPLAHR